MALSARDKALLDSAAKGLSAQEMSEVTGLPPERCKIRVDELLSERNVYDEVQKRQLQEYRVNKFIEQIEEHIENYGLDSKMAGVLLNGIKTLGDLVTQSEKITADQLRVITESQARAMMLLCSTAFQYARTELEREYPNVNVLQIEAAFTEGLRHESGRLASGRED